jgi:hypothetical protein
MENETIQIAIQVPEAFVDAINQYVTEHQEESVIELKVIPPDTSKGEELAFDPITLSPWIWMGLKFIGKTALSAALKMVGSAIYERWKKLGQGDQKSDIIVRFPNGESMTIDPEQPLDVKELEEKLKRSRKV